MVVECNNCQTRFQLDDSRIPLRGIRVRCSRCKVAFFLEHPDASESDAVHDVAADAARAPGSGPGLTQDLPSESSCPADADYDAAPEDASEEEDWEFNEPGVDAGDEYADDEGYDDEYDSDADYDDRDADDDDGSEALDAEDAEGFDGETGPFFDAEEDSFESGEEFGWDRARDDDRSAASAECSDDWSTVEPPDYGEIDADLGASDPGEEAEEAPSGGSVESDFGSPPDFSALAREGDEPPALREAPGIEARAVATTAEEGSPASGSASEGDDEQEADLEDWDFFSDDSLESPESPDVDAAQAIGRIALQPAGTVGAADSLTGPSMAPVRTGSGLAQAKAGLNSAGRGVGWGITLILLLLGFGRGLLPASPLVTRAPVAALGDFHAESVRGRWVETAGGGRIYVVTGRLVNDASAVRRPPASLEVKLLGGEGQPLEQAPAIAGTPLPEIALREASREARARAAADAAARLRGSSWSPGTGRDFLAYFEDVPADAKSFVLELSQASASRSGKGPERGALADLIRSDAP